MARIWWVITGGCPKVKAKKSIFKRSVTFAKTKYSLCCTTWQDSTISEYF